jgi:hypothetical protein
MIKKITNGGIMINQRVLGLDKKILLASVQFVLFIAIAITAPMTNQQFVSGPIVNATLFISAVTLGSSAAIMIGMIPSVVALSTGLLPAVLAPMVPFIIIGNALLVLVFCLFYKRNAWLGVISAGVIKYLFLFATSSLVVNLLFKKTIAPQVATMMSWPQLLTALLGGLIAITFLWPIKKRGEK